MNRLRNCRAYLAGPMDTIPGGGVVWRRRIQFDLRHMGIHWLDPCRKPCKVGIEDEATRELRHTKKAQGDWDWIANEMGLIRRVDIRMVDISDFLVVFLDKANSGFGTICELSRANSQMKPILVMQECGKQNTPDWLFGMLPGSMIFGDWGNLYEYLTCINECASIKHEQRWIWFDWMGNQKPQKSENFVAQSEGVARSDARDFARAFNIGRTQLGVIYDTDRNTFDRQGFYQDGPWPENLK